MKKNFVFLSMIEINANSEKIQKACKIDTNSFYISMFITILMVFDKIHSMLVEVNSFFSNSTDFLLSKCISTETILEKNECKQNKIN